MVVNILSRACLNAVNSHKLFDKLDCIFECSVASNLEKHRNQIKLTLAGSISEMILALVIISGIKSEIKQKCSALYVNLCALQSAHVKGLIIPAGSGLYALVGKKSVLDNGVIILNIGLCLNKSGHERASVANHNNLTVRGGINFLLCLYYNGFLNDRLFDGLIHRLNCGLFDGLIYRLNCGLFDRLIHRLNCMLFDGLIHRLNGRLFDGLIHRLNGRLFDGLTYRLNCRLFDGLTYRLNCGLFVKLRCTLPTVHRLNTKSSNQ